MSESSNANAAPVRAAEGGTNPSTPAHGESFTLSITDPQNKSAKGEMTISVEVKDNSLFGLSASDGAGDDYEIGFYLKKKKRPGPVTESTPAPQDMSPTGGGGDTPVIETDPPVENDPPDECQRCEVRDGILVCFTVPCPPVT